MKCFFKNGYHVFTLEKEATDSQNSQLVNALAISKFLFTKNSV